MVQDGRRVTSNQFGTEKPYTLGITDQHFVATANRRQGFAHPCTHTHTHTYVFFVCIYTGCPRRNGQNFGIPI